MSQFESSTVEVDFFQDFSLGLGASIPVPLWETGYS